MSLRSTLALALGLFGLTLTSCHSSEGESPVYQTISGERFHTYYHIKYRGDSLWTEAIDSTFRAFNHALNPFDSTSLITAINQGKSTQTDSMLRHVWRASVDIARASGGRYDVTCSPLINAWGFGFEHGDSPRPEVLDSLRTFVGYHLITLDGEQMVKADPRVQVNLSSISKGYCSDLVAGELLRRGSEHYLVELGGEIAWRGYNPRGEAWRIGINKPITDSTGLISEVQVILALDRPSGGLATSGNYRNYHTIDGRRVAHTIDARTGEPIQTDVLSATILAPTCMLADGLATACMTMRADEVPSFIAQFEGVEYLLILGNDQGGYTTRMSSGMERLVVP